MRYNPPIAVDKQTSANIDLNSSLIDDFISSIDNSANSEESAKLAVNPFNAKIMLSLIFKPLEVVKAIVSSADPKKVKKVMSEYSAGVGLTVLHVGALNADPRVLEYLVGVAQGHKIDLNKLIYIQAQPSSNEAVRIKDGGRTKTANFYHNWTALNIALHQDDTQKIKFLKNNGLSQLSLKSYSNDIRGSLFGMGIEYLMVDGSRVVDTAVLGKPEFIASRIRLCELATQLQSWGEIFNYDSSDTLENKSASITKSNLFQGVIHNFWLTFHSETIAKSEEFKTLILPAFLDSLLFGTIRDGAATKIFFKMFPKGLSKYQDLWNASEIQTLYDKMGQIEKETGSPTENLLEAKSIVRTILEKRMLSQSIEERNVHEEMGLGGKAIKKQKL